MRRDKVFVVVLTTLASLWSPLRAVDRSVSCLLSSSCVLPCPFDPGPEVVIHWLKPPADLSSVHSFYHDTDQLGRQEPRFKGRTSLFKERIPKGNASLRITGVELADGGRYKCYTSTIRGNNEDYVNMDVQAPVSDVQIEADAQSVSCVSSGIFPRPSVSWTPSFNHSPSVTPDQTGLFSVLSSVPLTQRPPLEYSCNISTEHSWRSATYRQTEGVSWSGSRTELSCAETEESIKSLVWIFNRTHEKSSEDSEVILRRSGSDWVYSPDWEHRLEPGPGTGLVLKDLSLDQQGLYYCELTTDLSTYLTVTEVTMEKEPADASTWKIVGGITAGVLGLVLVLVLLWRLKTKKQKPPNPNSKGDNPAVKMPLNELQPGNTESS